MRGGGAEGKQIPFGDDRKNCRSRSRFPSGMTERKARAKAKAEESFASANDNPPFRERKGRPPRSLANPVRGGFRDDRKNGKSRSRFPSGMTARKARAKAKAKTKQEQIPGR